jgi:hypothetical protein
MDERQERRIGHADRQGLELLTNAMVRLYKELFGLGPTNARTNYFDYRGNEAAGAASGRSLRSDLASRAPGPTWFLEARLAFSLGYALLRALRPPTRAPSRAPLPGRHVAGIVVAIAFSSFAAKLAFPEQFHL